MEELRDKLEYAVRFGLQNAGGSMPKAENIAQAKFRSMVGRPPSGEEIHELSVLTTEIDGEQQVQQGIPSVVGFD